jgi:hypothetical protein
LRTDESDSLRFVRYPLIHKVSCDEGSGTGFRVGLNHWLSVGHVTAMHNCMVDGAKIAVTEQDGKRDFSRFDTARGVPNGFRVDCHGFVPGQWYLQSVTRSGSNPDADPALCDLCQGTGRKACPDRRL